MIHIIIIKSKVKIEYIINDDIKKLIIIGAVAFDNSTVFASPTKIIWNEELRMKSYNKSIIDKGEESTSLSFFNINSWR